METDKSKRAGSEKGGDKPAKRRKKSRAFEKFEATTTEEPGTVLAVKQEHPEFSRSSSEGEVAPTPAPASFDANQPQVPSGPSRLEAERRVRAELQARLKEEEKTLAPSRGPTVVPARIPVAAPPAPAFAPSASLGQNAALLALPSRRAEAERKARLELQAKLQAESKVLAEERAKLEKAKAEIRAKAAKAAKESSKEAPENKDATVKEAKSKAKSKADAKAVKTAKAVEARAVEPKATKLPQKVASGVRKAPTPQAATEDGQLVPVKQEHARSRSSSEQGKGKKPAKASAAKAKAAPGATGHLFGNAVKPKAQAAAGADAMLLVEIVFKDKIRKVKHKASTKISELVSEYEPKIRAAHKELGALRVCDDKGVEQGSELTLSALRDGVASAGSSESVRLVFEEDDWLS